MKILWIDLNSSYAHSSLALPALHAQIMTDPSIEWEIVSATINENTGMIVDEIYRHRPDILAATTWLFNQIETYPKKAEGFPKSSSSIGQNTYFFFFI